MNLLMVWTILCIANPYINRRYFYLNLTILRVLETGKEAQISMIVPWQWLGQGFSSLAFPIRGHFSYETNLSPFQAASRSQIRLSRTQFYTLWPQGSSCASRKGPSSSSRLGVVLAYYRGHGYPGFQSPTQTTRISRSPQFGSSCPLWTFYFSMPRVWVSFGSAFGYCRKSPCR